MKLLWMIIAGVCIVVAAFMALRGRLDAAFVIASLGIVSWFLNYRIQLKEVIAAGEIENTNDGKDSNEDN